MVSTVCSGGIHGMDAFVVSVECDISEGFPGFDLVGLLSGEVKEARERTITALKNCGVSIGSRKVTVNMAPANVRKHGTGYDLPVAVSILCASGVVRPESADGLFFIGELMLSGRIGEVRGVMPIVRCAVKSGIRTFVVPKGNELEAAVIDDATVIAVSSLTELIKYLNGEVDITPTKSYDGWDEEKTNECKFDFCDVAGQSVAKRGLEIAAAGMHNVLMIGPPGTGKTFMAKCLPGILPPITKEEALEISSVYSVAGLLTGKNKLVTERPVIEVHHTATETAMAGGGNTPKPGLISLAHRGVLFLDEMPEFSKRVLEVMRQPLEDKVIHVAKGGYNVSYPASFMLVGALNPCPCGMYPDMKKCVCTDNMRRHYMGKLSKPLVDRMDLCLKVLKPDTNEIINGAKEEASAEVRKRVLKARRIQMERYEAEGGSTYFNSQMGIRELERFCELGSSEKALMERAIAKYDLSARSYHRVLKCSRTIADLDGSEAIKCEHITESLFFKSDVLR